MQMKRALKGIDFYNLISFTVQNNKKQQNLNDFSREYSDWNLVHF